MVQRILELGPSNALVANLADGQLEGGARPILIDPASLEQIKFIKEGAFDEVDGAPTLKIVGEAAIIPAGTELPVRTVREEITVEAILRNFIGRNAVEQPFAYFRQVSHEAGWISPIFYYLHLAGKTRKEAASALRSNKNAKPKCRAELIKLLDGKRSLYSKLGGNRSATFNWIMNSPALQVTDAWQAKKICSAMTGMTEDHAGFFDQFHSLLAQCLKLWEASEGDRELLSYIRRAASRLDEVEFGPLVPSD